MRVIVYHDHGWTVPLAMVVVIIGSDGCPDRCACRGTDDGSVPISELVADDSAYGASCGTTDGCIDFVSGEGCLSAEQRCQGRENFPVLHDDHAIAGMDRG